MSVGPFELHPELAPVAGFGLHADSSTHALNAFPHDRQADARAFILLHRVHALEDIENPV
jgi:hypothetical protein